MSIETLEIIQKHISDILGVELIRTYDKRADGGAFNINVGGSTIRIFIPGIFVSSIEPVVDMAAYLKELDILNFIKKYPGCNILFNTGGITIDPIDG